MPSNNGGLHSLTLLDYSDRELLLIVDELASADADGSVDTKTIADTIGIEGDFRLNSVASRMSVLKRIGATERDTAAPASGMARWIVTPIGKILATGKLNASLEKGLDSLQPEQILLATRRIGAQYREQPETAGRLMRREFRFATGLKSI